MGALSSWLFRIVRTECLRRARTWNRRAQAASAQAASAQAASAQAAPAQAASAQAASAQAAPAQAASAQAASAEEETLRRLEIDRITSAIAALPRDQRLVLVMRDVQGLPGGAVAGTLGLSTAAMTSRLHRARARVRAELAGAGPAGRMETDGEY
jgi:RNA polymerase sigma-70 factor (ECF subfamily)